MAAAKKIGFSVICPECRETATVRIALDDLTTCTCSSCDWEGSPQDAVELLEEQLAQWQAVQRWVTMAPAALAAGD